METFSHRHIASHVAISNNKLFYTYPKIKLVACKTFIFNGKESFNSTVQMCAPKFINSSAIIVQSVKKKRSAPTNSNINYRREMELVPINMNCSLLQFDALKFVLGIRLHEESVPNFNFFNVKPQI